MEQKPKLDVNLKALASSFFSVNANEQNSILSQLLIGGHYNAVASIFESAMLNSTDTPFRGESGIMSIYAQYFDLFLQKARALRVDEELIAKFAFSVFSEPKASPMSNYFQAATEFLKKQAYSNHAQMLELAIKYDPSFKSFSCFIEADRGNTLTFLLGLLLNGKNVKKANIRKFLLNININIFDTIKAVYYDSIVKKKEAIIRLFLVYKNDIRVSTFLKEVENSEKSKVILSLLRRDKKEVKASTKLSLLAGGKPNRIAYFFKLMQSGEGLSLKDFKENVLGDKTNAEIAGSLFFSVYTLNTFTDIVVVDNGRINDLDNNEKVLTEGQIIKVLHAVEITTKYLFLKRIRIKQIFEQVNRRTFSAEEDEKSANCFFKLSGSVVALTALKANMKKLGYKPLKKTGIITEIGRQDGDVLCVAEISPTDFSLHESSVSLYSVRFYAIKDVIKIGGEYFLDNVPKVLVTSINARAYSEFIHSIYELLENSN